MYPKLADRKAPDKLLYFDVTKCYVKLEHGMNLFEKESQLIFLLFFPVKGLGCEEMFNDLEGNLLAFLQCLEPFDFDRGEVGEQIFAAFVRSVWS